MPYDPMHHHRRSIRLLGYDYTQSGAYFITICSRDRACIFADIERGVVHLTAIGEIVGSCWEAIPDHFPPADLDAFVTMPNHLHGIVFLGAVIESDANEQDMACRVPPSARGMTGERFGAPVPGSIPTIVRSFKAAVTKAINDASGRDTACRVLLERRLGPLSPGRFPSLWQANYHEHIIRNDHSLDLLRDYVFANPARWSADSLHPDSQPLPDAVSCRVRDRDSTFRS